MAILYVFILLVECKSTAKYHNFLHVFLTVWYYTAHRVPCFKKTLQYNLIQKQSCIHMAQRVPNFNQVQAID